MQCAQLPCWALSGKCEWFEIEGTVRELLKIELKRIGQTNQKSPCVLYLEDWIHLMANEAPMTGLKRRHTTSGRESKEGIFTLTFFSLFFYSHCFFSLHHFSSLTIILINTFIYKFPKWIFFLWVCSILSSSNPLTQLHLAYAISFFPFFLVTSTNSLICSKQIFFIIKMNSSHQSKEVSA